VSNGWRPWILVRTRIRSANGAHTRKYVTG